MARKNRELEDMKAKIVAGIEENQRKVNNNDREIARLTSENAVLIQLIRRDEGFLPSRKPADTAGTPAKPPRRRRKNTTTETTQEPPKDKWVCMETGCSKPFPEPNQAGKKGEVQTCPHCGGTQIEEIKE